MPNQGKVESTGYRVTVAIDHIQSHTLSYYDSSRSGISPLKTPLPEHNTKFKRGKHPCLRWYSNPQSQQASDRRNSPLSLFDNNWIQPFSRSGHSRQNNVLQDILTRHIQTLDSGAAQFHVLSLCYTGVCIKNK